MSEKNLPQDPDLTAPIGGDTGTEAGSDTGSGSEAGAPNRAADPDQVAAPAVPADHPEPAPTVRSFGDRFRGASKRVVLGAIAGALTLLLVGCAGGYTLARVAGGGFRHDGFGRDGGFGPPHHGFGDHDGDRDGDRDGHRDRDRDGGPRMPGQPGPMQPGQPGQPRTS